MLDAHRLAAGDLEAAFVPSAGMVGVSLKHRWEELLAQRAGLEAYVERGKTFGIPLLHPWANRLGGDRYEAAGRAVELPAEAPGLRREEHGLPIHGLLAASPDWRVGDADATRLTAQLDFTQRQELLPLFPFPHTIGVTATLLPDRLTLETIVTATGGAPVPVAFGWHPYLVIPGVPRDDWVLGLPARRHLLVEGGIPTGETAARPPFEEALAGHAFDDGYDELAEPVLTLTGGGRSLAVHLEHGYPVTQVFAPPGQELVALEPMSAPTDALRTGSGLRFADPGEPFTARFSITVG